MKHNKEGNRVKRVQVTFTEEQWGLIERLRGLLGRDDAETVRNIVLAWLTEKSIVAESVKKDDDK
jgi:aryl-alcohol dehydrogenase-like predicted oxidoreductase